ncbi:MAG: YdcF family protein [Alphaproteobacteria bacterium]|nr:YdcF family protein [Alphaproteobacteria bacterium]
MFLPRPPIWLLIAVVAGGLYFKSSVPDSCPWLSDSEKIFVLTGDVRRIPFAMALLDNYPNRRLYIIGAGGNYSAMIPDDKKSKISIESESRTTYENAVAIREIARAQKINRIALVTTEDHVPRAMMLVRRRMPDAEIIPCPVPLYGMPVPKQLERWATEYVKYLGTAVGVETKK